MYHEGTTLAIGVVFGCPTVVIAVVTFLVAVQRRTPGWALIATVVSAPFCLFVSGYPLVGSLGVGVLGSNLLGALTLRRLGPYAMVFWVPFVMLAAWLAARVLGQLSRV